MNEKFKSFYQNIKTRTKIKESSARFTKLLKANNFS